MILSLGDVISLATRFAGRSDFSTSEVSQLANIALTEVTNRVYHKAKEFQSVSNLTGAGNERTVDLPSDFDGVVSMIFWSTSTGTNGVNTLVQNYDLPIVDISLINSESSTSGIPVQYAVYQGQVVLDPIPNSRGSLVMQYLAKQLPLVVSTETPFLDERWHTGWLNKTEELVHRARSNHVAAADAERRYVNFMTSTPNDRNLTQLARHGQGLSVRKA